MKLIKSLSLILVIAGLQITALSQSSVEQSTANSDLIKQTLKVKGATCKTDLGLIVDNVKKLEGVEKCKVVRRGATSTLEIEYYTTEVDINAIRSAIENTGTCEDLDARKYKVKL